MRKTFYDVAKEDPSRDTHMLILMFTVLLTFLSTDLQVAKNGVLILLSLSSHRA